jgi:2-iminobutanoate/2-iminopropanoate deaminase
MQRRDFLLYAATAISAANTQGSQPMSSTLEIKPIAPSRDTAFAEGCEVTGFKRLLFVSGQVPADANGKVPPDYPSQYRLAWANVERQLKAAGMSFDNLVKATIYLSDRALIAQSKGLRHSVLGDRTPAITIILAGIYDESWLLEIEAVAAA